MKVVEASMEASGSGGRSYGHRSGGTFHGSGGSFVGSD